MCWMALSEYSRYSPEEAMKSRQWAMSLTNHIVNMLKVCVCDVLDGFVIVGERRGVEGGMGNVSTNHVVYHIQQWSRA